MTKDDLRRVSVARRILKEQKHPLAEESDEKILELLNISMAANASSLKNLRYSTFFSAMIHGERAVKKAIHTPLEIASSTNNIEKSLFKFFLFFGTKGVLSDIFTAFFYNKVDASGQVKQSFEEKRVKLSYNNFLDIFRFFKMILDGAIHGKQFTKKA